MAVNYGAATLGVSDVPLISVTTTDPFMVIGQRIARRLQTPRGGMASIDPSLANDGWDVRQYTLARLSPPQIAQAQQQIAAECLKDEEVQSASVTLTFVNGGVMTISIQLVSSQGPFTLVLNVSQVSYSVLVQS